MGLLFLVLPSSVALLSTGSICPLEEVLILASGIPFLMKYALPKLALFKPSFVLVAATPVLSVALQYLQQYFLLYPDILRCLQLFSIVQLMGLLKHPLYQNKALVDLP